MAESAGRGKDRRTRYSGVKLFFRDAAVAAFIVASILLTMYAFAGQWPPLVVVESESMMHGSDNVSHLGIIDTGDLVLVQKVESTKDIVTYVEGYLNGHQTYGDYGDVVIYKVNGQTLRTPIIHRAMMYLEANADGTSYRVYGLREMPAAKWSSSVSTDTWDHLTGTVTIYNVGYDHLPVVVEIPHLNVPYTSGYITKGDHNTIVDQQFSGGSPVQFSWVVGKARGEIPWFGLLKLWSTGTIGSPAPENSVEFLYASIVIIVVAPILIDITMTYKEKRDSRKKRIVATARGSEPPDESEDSRKERF